MEVSATLRFALAPFSLLYGGVVRLRNRLYDTGLRPSAQFTVPVVCVGNLSVGGTGKTPHVVYITNLLKDRLGMVATLSRGYGRKSSGFRLAEEGPSPDLIGDEPALLHRVFGQEVMVTVGEDRALAISEICMIEPDIKAIVMDDGFQHRGVTPAVSLLLTDFRQPFYNDHLLPGGRLREPKKGAKRANAVVVTKCPVGISPHDMNQIAEQIRMYTVPDTPIFFSALTYGEPYPLLSPEDQLGEFGSSDSILLMTGIATPGSLIAHTEKRYQLRDRLTFPDHHRFSLANVEYASLRKKQTGATAILVTEKDAVKLYAMLEENLRLFQECNIWVQPVTVSFLLGTHSGGLSFDEWLIGAIPPPDAQ